MRIRADCQSESHFLQFAEHIPRSGVEFPFLRNCDLLMPSNSIPEFTAGVFIAFQQFAAEELKRFTI